MITSIGRSLKGFVSAAKNKLRVMFSTNIEVERSNHKVRPTVRRKRVISRQERRIQWCADFNRRNGYIVSDVSPISIYFKTHE